MLNSMIIPILTGIIGLVMIFAAEPIITVLVIALGIFLILSGISILVTMPKIIDDKSFKIDIYVRGGINLLLGLLCVILPATMVNFAWKTMMYIIGIYALCSAAMEIYAVTKLNEAEIPVKKYIIEIIGTVVAAIVLFMLPSSFGFTLIKIGGGILVLVAIGMAVSSYRHRDIIEDDAVVVDEDSEEDKE